MANTMTARRPSDPVRSLDPIRPTEHPPAKASLRPSDEVRPSEGIGLGQVVWDALMRHFGQVKAVADALGDVDPSLARREIAVEGKLHRLAKLPPDALAAVAVAMSDAYAPLVTPQARIRRNTRVIRQLLDEVDQFVEVA